MFSLFKKTTETENKSKNKIVSTVDTEAKKKAETEKKKKAEAEAKKKKAELEAKKKAEAEAKKKAEADALKKAELEKANKEITNMTDFIDELTGVKVVESKNQFLISSSLDLNDSVIASGDSDNVQDVTKKIGFVVLGYGNFASTNLFDSIMPYAKAGHHVVFLLDNKKSTDESFDKKLDKINQFKNVVIVRAQDNVFDFKKILLGVKLASCVYTVFVSLKDKLNPRSFITIVNSVITENASKKCFIPNDIDLYELKKYWGFSSLSGSLFNSRALLELNDSLIEQGNYWSLEKIIKNCSVEEVFSYDNEFVFNRYPLNKITSLEIAGLGKEIISGLKKSEDADNLLKKLWYSVQDLYANYELSKIQRFFLFAMVSYVMYLCERNSFDTETWKEKFNKIFDFGVPLKAKETQRMLNVFLPILFQKKDNDLFIVENVGMSDIKNSKFFELAQQNFKIDYQLKRSNFDYYDFNNMIIKMHSKSSKLTIASGSLNRNMLSEGDSHLTLWHGLGWMKKTVVKPDKFTVGDIVCSSEYCAPRYKEHFFALNALPLGSVQTDKLFDKTFRKECNRVIRETHGIPEDAKIIFFAPTFRIGKKHHYYDFGMDINALAEELAKNNVYLITKKHHVFESLMRDKGIDASGVYTSDNKHFIVDEHFDFNQLICACDAFATDYSSGMYYAFAIDVPVFLYAIDVDEYVHGPNGLEIEYPKSVPVPFVGEPSIQKFMQAYKDSLNSVNTEEYKAYKKDNVGACDGHVGEKLIKFIEKNYL